MPPLMVSQGKGKLIDKCDALYVWHKDAIFRMALDAVCGDKAWALRLLEECMVTAYNNIERFGDENSDESKSKMVAILQSLINRIYLEIWQKMELSDFYEEYKKNSATKKERFDVDQILIRNELTAELAKYVEKLTNDDKELIFMRFFMGMTVEELSKHFGNSPDETEKRVFLVKRKIARMMTER